MHRARITVVGNYSTHIGAPNRLPWTNTQIIFISLKDLLDGWRDQIDIHFLTRSKHEYNRSYFVKKGILAWSFKSRTASETFKTLARNDYLRAVSYKGWWSCLPKEKVAWWSGQRKPAHTETLTTQQEDGTECGETEKMTGRLFTNGRFQTKPLTKIPNHVRYSIEVW
jgi:hypothetical protein